jgi:hypothetical protein
MDAILNGFYEFFGNGSLHKVILQRILGFPNGFMVPRIEVFNRIQKIPALLIRIHEPKGHVGLRAVLRLFQNGLIDPLDIGTYLGLITKSAFSGTEGEKIRSQNRFHGLCLLFFKSKQIPFKFIVGDTRVIAV